MKKTLIISAIGIFLALAINLFLQDDFFAGLIFLVSVFLLLQGGFASWAMLSSWLTPKNLEKVRIPKKFAAPRLSFSLIIPVRNEEKVIAQTLAAVKKINYPKNLFEVLVVARDDDTKTVGKILESLNHLPPNFNLLVYKNYPNSKPESLNAALEYCQKDVIAIFDAEDEPHPEILNAVNTKFLKEEVDIIQSGVQLVNVPSYWFSPFNCLEYYFWFKSILPLFSRLGANPLGGNTVFFKREIIKDAKGWDTACLTEDAEIGVRLSANNRKTAVIYDEQMATREETPPNLSSFIKQRTRWHQGYLQVFLKGDWKKLKDPKQKFIIAYLLIYPFIQVFNTLWLLLTPFLSFLATTPLWLAIFSYFPGYFLLTQWGISLIGLWELKKYYQLKFSPLLYLKFFLYYFPYQFVICFATLRAIKRQFLSQLSWEKTEHLNVHRNGMIYLNDKT